MFVVIIFLFLVVVVAFFYNTGTVQVPVPVVVVRSCWKNVYNLLLFFLGRNLLFRILLPYPSPYELGTSSS